MFFSKRHVLTTCAIVAALHWSFAQAHDESSSTQQDQKNVSVTIYNNNLALVKDQRRIQLASGQSFLAFRDISAQIRPETALLRSLTAPGELAVIEQNFDFDLLTPQKMLEKYIGKTVGVIKVNPTTGAETIEQAQVLAANNGVVLKMGDHIETGIPGRIVYPEVPVNLRDRPTLVMSLNNGGTTQQEVELSYLTGGLGWRADYVAGLNAAGDKLDLSGWITLTNTSGATFRNAKLQLVAGDINRVSQAMPAAAPLMAHKADMAANVRMQEESLFEYHLYSLDHPTTISENQTKQVALLSAIDVPVHKELLLQGNNYYYQGSYGDLGQKIKVGVFIEFDNKESAHLGMPLPKGIMRVYQKDGGGNAQFIGEDSIDHTPKNEKIRLKLGDAFDVTAAKKQTDFKKISGDTRYNYIFESAYEIVLKNAKKEPVALTVQEPMPGDWQVLKESHPHIKDASNMAVWHISVPPEGQTVLNYQVRVRY